MTSDQTKELSELLKQTREYVRYFGELGAETIGAESVELARTTLSASPTKTEQPPTAKPAVTVTSLHAEKSIQLTQPVKSAALSTAPQDGLFGGASSPTPVLPASTETLEDIWLDIGDCTRCALCSGRTQVVNTHGNPKARLMFVGEA